MVSEIWSSFLLFLSAIVSSAVALVSAPNTTPSYTCTGHHNVHVRTQGAYLYYSQCTTTCTVHNDIYLYISLFSAINAKMNNYRPT